MNVIRGFKVFGRGVRRASPYILTGTAIVGVGVTTVTAVKATPGAMESLKAATEEKQRRTGDPEARLTKLEAVQTAGPHYIPTGISAALTGICMVASTKISMGRAAGAAAAATLAQNALGEAYDKIEEKFGKDKAQEVRDEVIADKLKAQPVSSAIVHKTGQGSHLCYDVYSGRYFMSDIETLRKAMNDFNERLLRDLYLDLNEWYWRIGLDPVGFGYEIGWNPNKGLLDLVFGTQIADNDEPCLTVDFHKNAVPYIGFDSSY